MGASVDRRTQSQAHGDKAELPGRMPIGPFRRQCARGRVVRPGTGFAGYDQSGEWLASSPSDIVTRNNPLGGVPVPRRVVFRDNDPKCPNLHVAINPGIRISSMEMGPNGRAEPICVIEVGMTYVVTESCILCKYMDCVEVCPVDCFYVGENMLVIHPDECIDCGVCEPECPAEAIVADSDDKSVNWLERNRIYAAEWPNITRKGSPPDDADSWKHEPGKEQYFSPKPGKP